VATCKWSITAQLTRLSSSVRSLSLQQMCLQQNLVANLVSFKADLFALFAWLVPGV
jgi:hypothetical protein